ncbi:MAG: gliding motility protein GldN [Flavobacteriales bacterium]|nr:gliding motility protein GldN [Flavobacteriales bacterium]
MKRIVLVLVSVLTVLGSSYAQNVLDGVYEKEHFTERIPQKYPALREADVMWSRKVWREIDLRQKINHPFYYPAVAPGQETVNDRKSLIDVVMNAILEGSIIAYGNAVYDDEFKTPMTQEEIDAIGGAKQEVKRVYDWAKDDGSEKDTLIVEEFDRTSVKMWRVKEEWFFDKQRSVMDQRIIGLCPLKEAKDEFGDLTGGYEPLFWIYFPDSRGVFANAEVFNMMKNDAERRTYDDIFWKRMFSSYIIKEANVMDRKIQSYMIGLDALLESERIKSEIFNIEHDLWEY